MNVLYIYFAGGLGEIEYRAAEIFGRKLFTADHIALNVAEENVFDGKIVKVATAERAAATG